MSTDASQPTTDTIDTVVMSGGAPQSPLMAGFLYALLKRDRVFRNYHTSGAGALMALLLIAPRNGDPLRTLEGWVEAGVADEIYASFPVNFKLFHKPGPFSPIFQRMAERFKVPLANAPVARDDPVRDMMADLVASARPKAANSPSDRDALDRIQDRLAKMWTDDPDPDLYAKLRARADPLKRMRERWLGSWLRTEDDKRVYNDLVDLWFSAITPSTLSQKSKGLAAPLPFLEDLVAFEKLKDRKKFKGHLCVNAYNMTKDANLDPADRKHRDRRNKLVMEIFDESEIDGNHIRAAFSMPFIYPPARIGDDYYSEGADHQPINFHTLGDLKPGETRKPSQVVLLDVLADLEDLLVRTPRDLWDAYVISIMTPVVALAHEDVDDFEAPEARAKHGVELIHADWQIPEEFKAYVMDWSRSNLQKLFEVGRDAGDAFLQTNESKLPRYSEVFG